MDLSVESIEIRRLRILEEQAALYGPQTDPSILIEIAELRHKKRQNNSDERRAFVTTLDFQFVMDVVAAALVRLGQVEANQHSNKTRQLVFAAWMIIMSVVVIVTMILQFQAR
jgi:hypothetical protein